MYGDFPENNTNAKNLEKMLDELNTWCVAHQGNINHLFTNCVTQEDKITKLFWCVKQILENDINITNGWNELYNFVKDFFDNLNLQDEVNNKINQMVADGTIKGILAELIPPSCEINVLYPPYDLEPLVNDGVTDNAEKLQAILNYMKTNNLEGRLCFPSGSYLFNSGINVDMKHITFHGVNRGACKLISGFNGTLFNVGTADGSSLVNFVTFENLFFNTNVPQLSNQHNYITFSNVSYCFVDNCSFYNGCKYIFILTSLGIKINNVNFNNETDAGNVDVVAIQTSGKCPSCKFTKCVANFLENSGTIVNFFRCVNYVQDFYFNEIDTTGCTAVFYFDNSGTQAPGDLFINNCICDFLKGYFIIATNIASPSYSNSNIVSNAYLVTNKDSLQLIRLKNCTNFVFSKVNANNINSNTAVDVFNLLNCRYIEVRDCVLSEFNRGVVLNGCDNCSVNGIIVRNSIISGTCSILAQSVEQLIITGCILVGDMTALISIDDTSKNVLRCVNQFIGIKGSTSSITDNGVGSVAENNITQRT